MGVLARLLDAVGLRRPTLWVVLGADSCRYVVVSHQTAVDDESVSVGRVATQELVRLTGSGSMKWPGGKPDTGDQDVKCNPSPSANPPSVDAEVLVQVLTDLRRRAASGLGRRPYLAVTARPDLLAALDKHLPSAVRRAGFQSYKVVAEHVCIATAARLAEGNGVLVDVGHIGTRVWR